MIQVNQLALVEHLATVQEIIENRFTVEIKEGNTENYNKKEEIPNLITTSCRNLIASPINRPMSRRMMDFLELITSISFADTALLEDNYDNYETTDNQKILVCFYKTMQQVIEKYNISRWVTNFPKFPRTTMYFE